MTASLKRTFAAMALLTGFVAPAHAGKWFKAETLDDHCSVSVVIKVPFSNKAPFTDPADDKGDVILARSQNLCQLVTGGAPTHKGVCGNNKWTDWIPYSSIQNSDRRFRWFCGQTAERSRCAQGTGRIRSRLGPDRLFRTECWKWDPTQ